MSAFQFSNQTRFYKGKVRDVYTIADQFLVMIASDRISAFDVILPRTIPYKGQVLNQFAAFMLKKTKDICPNWLINVPAPNASVGYKCNPFRIEVVVRGNLCGHAWRTYNNGQRLLCGTLMSDGLKENDFFSQPIITPSTKASEGHDEDISESEILKKGLATENQWEKMKQYALQLFDRGKELALKHELILADTKYEFGLLGEEIVLIDEIHTPDSSRYFYANEFKQRQENGEKQKQLSKEFVREWLLLNEFMGKEGQTVPEMTDEWVNIISERYIELYEAVTGLKFIPKLLTDDELLSRINNSLKQLIDI